ncbi:MULTISPECIES: xylulokinase [unclassified Herbaspirillum]|uniref:xylulokinase n=1 Tax=unclassified Herbaspirillum TaxID=2624150 RepID=UPI00114F706C|nr:MULTISPECIES: xylulokinase [unclassified Herbaspirillum]MBB5392577.1 xylulokinase [Herbaspirillum sp. SJZ102]TQK06214.1 xylulokinase [Herbaspirillum sp. SJZ130]TQK12308.1 xylulokinase [Herbaspirillum sp. SJZ106]TWC68418.1 xylulokinase [Herbaspirillum sp. SJZ099]
MYLGIDLGTSEVKAVVIGADGALLALAGSALNVSRPHPRWSEQAPADWWQAACDTVAKLRAQLGEERFAGVRAIGLSGQMHGAVLLDEDNHVLRPAILWSDSRSAPECAELSRRAPRLHGIAGNLAMPGFTAPKLMWVARHEPALFARIATVLLPKDWLRLQMTGRKVSDPSDAAGTLWLDVEGRNWSDELLAASGMRRDQMPALVDGSAASGTLLPAVARAWGLKEGVIVAGGAGDGAASAVGIGAVNPGDGFLSLGTSGVLFVVNDRFRPNPARAIHAFCHTLPQRWHQMSVMLSAASCLRWFCRLCSVDEKNLLAEIEQLDAEQLANAPLFLPYLSGERTPHNDPYALGVFHGLSPDHQRAALGYAVLEGVAFGMVDGLDALRAAGTDVSQLSLVGGGARSAYWAQLIADALNVRIVTHVGSEAGGALGAARLAWLADGGEEAQVCRKPEQLASFAPDARRHVALLVRLRRYRDIYAPYPPLQGEAGG